MSDPFGHITIARHFQNIAQKDLMGSKTPFSQKLWTDYIDKIELRITEMEKAETAYWNSPPFPKYQAKWGKIMRRADDKYVIRPTTDPCDRAVYYQRHGRAIGLPLTFLRGDAGMEACCEELVADANKGARRKSIYDRRPSLD